MVEIAARITIYPEQCGGRPCIRGMEIRVTDILELLVSWLSPQQILDYATRRLDNPVVAM